MESNHIGASFYLHAIFFQVYHSCTRCAKYTADKQPYQPPHPSWCARRYFGNFQSILIREFFCLYWFPFYAPPSSDCTLPNFGFITPCRISQGRRTRTATNRTKIYCATITPYLVGRGCCPPMLALLGGTLLEAFLRYSHVLWAGLEPAWRPLVASRLLQVCALSSLRLPIPPPKQVWGRFPTCWTIKNLSWKRVSYKYSLFRSISISICWISFASSAEGI